MTKVLVAKLSGLYINMMMYLDDWLIKSLSQEQAFCDLQLTMMEVQRIGFLINIDKLMLMPTQKLISLGVNWGLRKWDPTAVRRQL